MQPIPVVTDNSYGLVDYTLLHTVVFSATLQPYATFPFLAKVLADLEVGDGRGLSALLTQQGVDQDCPAEALYLNAPDAQTAIMCTDGQKVRDTPEEFKSYYETMLKTSHFGQWWANIRLGCSCVFLRDFLRKLQLTMLPNAGDGKYRSKIVSQVWTQFFILLNYAYRTLSLAVRTLE